MHRLTSKVLAAGAVVSLLLLAGSAQAGHRYRYFSDYRTYDSQDREYCEPKEEVPAPEPSAALVFGVGLLVASRLTRKRR